MSRAPSAPLAAVALALTLLTSSAHAQSGEGEAPEAVLVLLREGVARRAAGDDVGALSRFEQARALAPSLGRARAQIGLVEHALGRWADAEASLVAALASDDPWIGRHRDELLASLEIVRSHLPATGTGTGSQADPGTDAVAGTDADADAGTGADPGRSAGTDADADAGTDADADAGTDAEVESPAPHALVWVGLATSLAGLAALLPTFLLALDAQVAQQAAFDTRCPAPQTAACAPDHARAEAALEPWVIGLDVLWGVVAIGGVLAAVGIGLSVAGSGSDQVSIDRGRLTLRF